MKWITELVGVVLCIQGFGGGLSAILDGGRSWFLVRYVLPEGAQIPVAVVIALVGVVMLATNSRKRQDV
jgi:preprotein translocase subunit SecG